jgi:hypothetical protein
VLCLQDFLFNERKQHTKGSVSAKKEPKNLACLACKIVKISYLHVSENSKNINMKIPKKRDHFGNEANPIIKSKLK